MSRIQKHLDSLNGKKALVAFYTAGDPNLDASKEIFAAIEKSGADIIEIGVPFSDPLADGPTIQASSYRSLNNGTTLKKIIQLVCYIFRFFIRVTPKLQQDYSTRPWYALNSSLPIDISRQEIDKFYCGCNLVQH